MILIVHSNSTEKYAQRVAKHVYNSQLLNVSNIKGQPTVQKGAKIVIGIGGGKTLDYAKIMAGQKSAITIPTTPVGAAVTSHAVYWEKDKHNFITGKPIPLVFKTFLEDIPKDLLRETCYDALAHSLDSYWSKQATPESKKLSITAYNIIVNQMENNFDNVPNVIEAGNIAGEAIQKTGTNMIHAVSYPLTLLYNIPHRLAVGWAIKPIAEYQECDLKLPKIDVTIAYVGIKKKSFAESVAEKAMYYAKIHQAKKDITKEKLKEILEVYYE